MANSSIPNSRPATGRNSTTSSRRLKSSSKRSFASSAVRRWALHARKTKQTSNAEHRTSNVELQRRQHLNVGRWTLDVERWAFSSLPRRVKGAWWPSRSSKPSSPRKWRGRFDSYPLRQIIFDFQLLIVERPVATALRAARNSMKGGEPYVA